MPWNFFQNKSHNQEQKAYRQQLISLLHHAEGLRDSVNSIQIFSLTGASDPSLQNNRLQLYHTLDSIKQNANAQFFGIMETKVGGIKLLDDLDTKYEEWSSLELDRKIESTKQTIEMTQQSYQTYGPHRTSNTSLKESVGETGIKHNS